MRTVMLKTFSLGSWIFQSGSDFKRGSRRQMLKSAGSSGAPLAEGRNVTTWPTTALRSHSGKRIDAVAVFIQPAYLDKGAVALAFNTFLGIALPDTHHRVQAFLFFVRVQLRIWTAISRVLLFLHRVCPALQGNMPPTRLSDQPPGALQIDAAYYRDSAVIPGYKRAETAGGAAPPPFPRRLAIHRLHRPRWHSPPLPGERESGACAR